MTETEDELLRLGKDVFVSLVILLIILGSLYAFAGRWPPMVVVESGSMMHGDDSEVGAIDPADIVLVQETDQEEITTYIEGKATGYKKYGQYGDVIIFEPGGDKSKTPVIHRPVLYLEYDENQDVYNIPSLADLEYGKDWAMEEAQREEVEDGRGLRGTLYLYDYGHEDSRITLTLENLRASGFITKGDNNRQIDQESAGPNIQEPIDEDWVLGRAKGELPWFGIIKLTFIGRTRDIPSNSWINFGVSIGIILLLPLITEIGTKVYDEFSSRIKNDDSGNQEIYKELKSSGTETEQPPIDETAEEDETEERSAEKKDVDETEAEEE